MCGRFTLALPTEKIKAYFHVNHDVNVEPSYNIAPSQAILAVRQVDDQDPNFAFLHWGFIPAWAKEEHLNKVNWINVRIESAVKLAFINAFKHRRCLIVADGFYEWQVSKAGKKPYYIFNAQHLPLAFAGIWEKWKSPAGEIIESCAILTTDASESLRTIHHRMPIMIEPKNFARWLDPANHNTEQLINLCHHAQRMAETLSLHQV